MRFGKRGEDAHSVKLAGDDDILGFGMRPENSNMNIASSVRVRCLPAEEGFIELRDRHGCEREAAVITEGGGRVLRQANRLDVIW